MGMNLASWQVMARYTVYFQQGVIYTVLLSLLTVVFGFFLALVLAMMRIAKPGRSWLSRVITWILRFISSTYIEVVRGTPMLVQLSFIYYVVYTNVLTAPNFTLFGFIEGSRFIPGIVALSLNSGAYLAEIIRAGIQGVDYGQTEAARSLGLSSLQNMRYIILPQAIKNILPAIANEFVVIVKESSICSVLGMQEIMFNTKLVQTATFRPAEPLVVAALLYFCLTFPTSKIIRHFERRMRRGDIR